jgi:hypothetical protein
VLNLRFSYALFPLLAMKRQQNGFMICEWGCHEWFKVGKDQVDHQLRRCPKRIIACSLGCPLKHKQEVWLTAAVEHLASERAAANRVAKAGDDDESDTAAGENDDENDDTISVQSDELSQLKNQHPVHSYGSQTQSVVMRKKRIQDYVRQGGVLKSREGKKAMRGITYQQYHETEECPKRLVVCPKQCLEWVCFEVLEDHLLNRCTKRPAKPLECRSGCGAMFGGSVSTKKTVECVGYCIARTYNLGCIIVFVSAALPRKSVILPYVFAFSY